jgi:hypothetical protein
MDYGRLVMKCKSPSARFWVHLITLGFWVHLITFRLECHDVTQAPFTWDQDEVKPEWKLKLSTCWHETGNENHKIFILFPLPGDFLFSMTFVSMCCSNVKVTAETGLKCICVYNYPRLQSEFMPVWSQSTRSSRQNDLRPVWVIFVPVSRKFLL